MSGDARCTSRRFSILPATWTDYDDAAYLYGQMQSGDVIGPWIFARPPGGPQQARLAHPHDDLEQQGRVDVRYGWGNYHDDPPDDFPAAKSTAESNYSGSVSENTAPHAWSYLSNHHDHGPYGNPLRGHGEARVYLRHPKE